MFGDELGLDPSPELQRLQHAILAQDPSLDWHPALVARGSTSQPRQGRHPIAWFQHSPASTMPLGSSGRERLTARLVERVRTTRLLAVVGASGSGKSSLVRAGLVASARGEGTPNHRSSTSSRRPPTRSRRSQLGLSSAEKLGPARRRRSSTIWRAEPRTLHLVAPPAAARVSGAMAKGLLLLID